MSERERFEAWAKLRGNQMQMIEDEYACPITSDQWEAWQAACPDGWQCVPLEPIEQQVDAGCQATGDCERLGECHNDCRYSPALKVYRAMLLAAPDP